MATTRDLEAAVLAKTTPAATIEDAATSTASKSAQPVPRVVVFCELEYEASELAFVDDETLTRTEMSMPSWSSSPTGQRRKKKRNTTEKKEGRQHNGIVYLACATATACLLVVLLLIGIVLLATRQDRPFTSTSSPTSPTHTSLASLPPSVEEKPSQLQQQKDETKQKSIFTASSKPRVSSPLDVVSKSGPRAFLTTEELQQAVDKYLDGANDPQSELAQTFGHPIGQWDVSNIEDFSRLFSFQRNPKALNFNEDISQWNVSSGTDFSYFAQGENNPPAEGTQQFNQDLSAWSTSNAKTMKGMFQYAFGFTGQGLTDWDVSNVENFSEMFNVAVSFNSDLRWTTTKAKTMNSMFASALSFEGGAGIESWDTSNVEDMSHMFESCEFFQADLKWKTHNVRNMAGIFSFARNFNSVAVSDWNTSKVEDFSYAFQGTDEFNIDISSWSTESATDLSFMFDSSLAFSQDLSSWDVSNVKDISGIFSFSESFNHNLCAWGESLPLDTQTSGAFMGTPCIDVGDPDLSANPAGPFCAPC